MIHSSSLEHFFQFKGRLYNSNIIELPEEWRDMIDESTITIQLTPIAKYQELYVNDIYDNMVIVKNKNSEKINCFYSIFAEKKE